MTTSACVTTALGSAKWPACPSRLGRDNGAVAKRIASGRSRESALAIAGFSRMETPANADQTNRLVRCLAPTTTLHGVADESNHAAYRFASSLYKHWLYRFGRPIRCVRRRVQRRWIYLGGKEIRLRPTGQCLDKLRSVDHLAFVIQVRMKSGRLGENNGLVFVWHTFLGCWRKDMNTGSRRFELGTG